MSGWAPKIASIRFRLYASTCRLISVRTRGSVLVRKWVAPIHALSVPKGCSAVCRRTRIDSGCASRRACTASSISSCSQPRPRQGEWLAALGDMASGNWNCRDVELSVLTNSPGTTDLRIINFGARYPIKAVSDHVGAVGRTNRAARVRYFEYRPQGDIRGQSDLSLHSKVSVLGPDMIIGSANADVRSFMMDTNNGVFIGNAPALKQRYLDWLDEILQDRGRTMELTGQMRNLSLEQMLAEDRVVAKAFVERKLSGRFEEEPPLDPALDELERILTNIYGLSAKALGGGPGTAKARQRYDALLKLF